MKLINKEGDSESDDEGHSTDEFTLDMIIAKNNASLPKRDIIDNFKNNCCKINPNTNIIHFRQDTWSQELKIENYEVKFKLDTGAQVNV